MMLGLRFSITKALNTYSKFLKTNNGFVKKVFIKTTHPW